MWCWPHSERSPASLSRVRKAVAGGLCLFINQVYKIMPSYVPPGPRIFVTKGCLQGTRQGAFSQQREVVDSPRRGRSFALLPFGSLDLSDGKSHLNWVLRQSLLSPLPSLKTASVWQRGGIDSNSFCKSQSCLGGWKGRNLCVHRQGSIHWGVVDQRQVRERQPEAGTRVRSIGFPSVGATPRLRGSGPHWSAGVARSLP